MEITAHTSSTPDPTPDPTPGPTDTIEVDWFTRKLFNPLVAWLTGRGLSVKGSRILTVAGRSSGEPRSTVINQLELDGERYLVAPRGQTQWVRNLRVAGTGSLRVGRQVENITVTELADDDKVAVLRAYLTAWAWEVGKFFGDLRATSSDEEILAAAHRFPAFRIDE